MASLEAYWELAYAQDPSVPALKPFVVREGERLWREMLEVGERAGDQRSSCSSDPRWWR